MTTDFNTTQTVAAQVAGVFSFDVRNTSISKVTKPVYKVEDTFIDGDNIDVDYLLNGQYSRTVIAYAALAAFVADRGLNDYTNDSADHAGEHVQECGTVPVDEFIDDEMNYCVKEYLQSVKAVQIDVN